MLSPPPPRPPLLGRVDVGVGVEWLVRGANEWRRSPHHPLPPTRLLKGCEGVKKKEKVEAGGGGEGGGETCEEEK